MKKKFHYFDLEQQRLKKHSASDNFHIKSRLLTKYCPKYLKGFVMTKNNGAITSKVKGAKIIKAFGISISLKNRTQWRTLLANKMKNVKVLTNKAESSRVFAEKIKLFSGLQSVQILLNFLRRGSFGQQDKQLEFFLSKTCRNIGRVQNLQHLEASPLSIGSKKCMTRLNSHQKLLDALETFKTYFDWTGTSDDEISELIENNKNLWRNVTSLRLSTLHSHFHFESFRRLGELSPKITNLSFEFTCREIINQVLAPRIVSEKRFEVKTNYLQTLKAFQHLRVLSLQIADVFTFLKDFVLPPSIQSLKLDFKECLSKEIMLRIDQSFADFSREEFLRVFKVNSLLLRFYDRFKGLDQLENLELSFAMESHNEDYKYQNYLFQSLLKRISSPLKNLVISPSIPFGKLNQVHEVPDSSLPQFIGFCESFAPTLEKLKIGSPKVIYSKFDLSASWHKFTKLSCIDIKANFSRSQESDMNMIGSFMQNFVCLGESITLLTLQASINRNAESLLSVLKQINQLQRPNKLKIRLFLNLQNFQESEESISFSIGVKKLQSNEKCYSKAKRVVLNYSGYSCADEFQPFMTLYQDRFENSFE